MISLDNVFDTMNGNHAETETYGNEVVHNDIDYGNEKNDLFALRSNELMCYPGVSYQNDRNPKGAMAGPFPVKLHKLLDHIEQDGLAHVVLWQPHGRCFVVHNQQKFVDVIMPLYFKQTKFPSFQRQLNLYGFNRLTSGPDRGGYYHEFFLRGKKFLALRIQRLKIKGTGVRKPSSPDTEPQFYFMPPVLPEVQEDDGVTANSAPDIHRRPMEGMLYGTPQSPSPLYTAGEDRIQAINRIILTHTLARNQMHGLPTALSELQDIILKQQCSVGNFPSAMKSSTVLPNRQSSQSSLQLQTSISEWMSAFSASQTIPSTPTVAFQCQSQNMNHFDVESDDASENEFDHMLQTLGELPIEMTSTTFNPLAADYSLASLLDTMT